MAWGRVKKRAIHIILTEYEAVHPTAISEKYSSLSLIAIFDISVIHVKRFLMGLTSLVDSVKVTQIAIFKSWPQNMIYEFERCLFVLVCFIAYAIVENISVTYQLLVGTYMRKHSSEYDVYCWVAMSRTYRVPLHAQPSCMLNFNALPPIFQRSSGGVVVKLLACGAIGPGFDSRPRRYDFQRLVISCFQVAMWLKDR